MNRRQTHQKELILRVVEGIGKHLTAEDVLHQVKEIDPSIGLATIYRNLGLFCKEGRIQKVLRDGICYYDGNPIPHDHFVCVQCGKIEDIHQTYNDSIDKKVLKSIKGTILRHSTTYEGYCSKCIKQEEKTWN